MGTEAEVSIHQSKYKVVAQAIETLIIEQKLQPGDKVHSIRKLSADYGVAKNTVIHALHLLESKSLIEARPKSGFVVKPSQVSTPPTVPIFDDIKPSKVAIPDLLQNVMLRGAAFDITPTAPTEPAQSLMSKLHRNINKNMRTQAAKKVMYYDEPQGNRLLREQLALHYRYLGVDAEANQMTVTGGCQHALFLALMATCNPGDNVIIESPGFYGVIQLLDQLGLHAIEVPSHSQAGLNVEVLQQTLTQFSVSACVVSPAYATPSGASMSDEDKELLVALANRYNFALIEDDIYGDLGFRQRPKPLKSFDSEDRVILCSSFSKSLSRDLRIGWVIGGQWQERINRLKLVSHLACNQSVQLALFQFMQEGDFKRYLRHIRSTLETQRNQLVHALHKYWEGKVKFAVPDGGLSMWVELPSSVDTLTLYNKALANNIVITPGVLFSVERDFSHFMRLSYCHPTTGQREQAIKKLRALIYS